MKRTRMLAILVLALGLTAEVANADFIFGEPTNMGATVNSVYREWDPAISANGLLLFFNSLRPGGFGGSDIWVATSITKEDKWNTPENLGPSINTAHEDYGPSISADELELYFCSDRPGGYGGQDLWVTTQVTTRVTTDAAWGPPVNLGPTVNSSSREQNPSISADRLWLFFASERPGGSGDRDLYVTTRATTDDEWGEPVNLGPTVNSSSSDGSPDISADGLCLFFASQRPGGSGRGDLWFTRRASTSRPWEPPVWLGPTINSSYGDGNPCISANGSTLYFISDRPGGPGNRDIWQAPIEPVVDLNGDGIVDSTDMCIIVDHWGTDEPLCDIGPMPWGDGIVDVQDLIVLAEHLFEEIPPVE